MGAGLMTEQPLHQEEARGDTAVARVESLNHEGQGVARVAGKAVFIRGALPGETVRFRYFNRRAHYDTAGVVAILEPSPHRIDPPRCRHFGVCGGCALQHFDAPAQLQAKQQLLLNDLDRIGKVAPETVLPAVAGPAWHYRRKARLGVRLVPKKGGVLVGFREHNRTFITPLDVCEVLDARAAALLPELRGVVSRLSAPARLPQIEVAVGEPEAALVFRHLEPLTAEDRAVLTAFGEHHGVQIHLQPGRPESVYPLWPGAPPPLSYRLPAYDLTLAFGPADFIQVNAVVNQRLIAQALALLDLEPQDRVLDLFCGLGNFTLPLARHAAGVTGVEADTALIARAQENARRNALPQVQFIAADLYRQGQEPNWPWQWDAFDKLLLDPPRTGALEVIRSLPAAGGGPRRIVYVSCHPATLARDSAILVHRLGYRLVSAGVLDMFPQTNHMESMALFERR